MKTIITIFLFCSPFICFAAQTNYIIYHQNINKAEEFYFINHNYDSAVYYYKTTFACFDFCFAKDCLIASQLALFEKNMIDAKLFLSKGFENGLQLDSLQTIKYKLFNLDEQRVTIFDTIYKNRLLYNELESIYKINRKKYLARINKVVLLGICQNYFIDQCRKKKRIFYKETEDIRDSLYAIVIKNNMQYLDSVINLFGLPLEKICGIVQEDILAELGYKNKDVLDYFKKESEYNRTAKNIEENQFTADENDFVSKRTFVQILHYPCYYFKNKEKFFSQIQKGELHPREAAMIHDFVFTTGKDNYDKKVSFREKLYNCHYPEFEDKNYKILVWLAPQIHYQTAIDEINERRSKYLIRRYEVDIAMKIFEYENGMKLNSFGMFLSM
jgi:hypothetical protein